MKNRNTLILMIIMIMLSFKTTFGQDSPQFTLKTNPLPVLWSQIPFTGEYRLMFEAATAPKQSAQIGASYLGPSAILNLENLTVQDTSGLNQNLGIRISGFRFQGQYKFYLSNEKSAPDGFYVGPHFSYATATMSVKSNPSDYIKATYMNFNAMIGYQLIAIDVFALDMFTGLGYKSNKWETVESNTFDEQTGKDGVKVSFGFNLGVAF